MRAGFFRRLTSALIDLTIVILIAYFSFVLFGRTILQNQVTHFDDIDEYYQEVIDAYNEDNNLIQVQYEEQRELAGDDEEARIDALNLFKTRMAVLNRQYALDSSVYNRLLLDYNMGLIYYFTIGVGLLLAILVLTTSGNTIGRRILKIKLEGQVNFVNIFIHDLLLKYFLVIMLILISPYHALIIIPIYFLIDLVLILITKDKTTIRDNLSRIIINYQSKKKTNY
ncbi:MAG: RDD family protein [Candidatus Izimaplasma sp.]|nr:RDD family protein [Candidatus Izimaplasma bacterium]